MRPSVTLRTPARRQPVRQRHRRGAVGEGGDQVPDLAARQAAGQRDLLDAAIAQIAREADERRACPRGRRVPSTTTSSPMKPIDDRRRASAAVRPRSRSARRCRAGPADGPASTARSRAAPRRAAGSALRPCSAPSEPRPGDLLERSRSPLRRRRPRAPPPPVGAALAPARRRCDP